VRAAGGLVWRRSPAAPGDVEVAIIHRPKYDDWSFPKGKADHGETADQTALREVEEETGLRARLGPELGTTRYVDPKGRDKVVHYWAMTVEEQHRRQPDDEVDEWRWVPVGEAAALLSYPRDRDLLAALRAVLDRR
jgi:8-oxo-dGTP pyrophosphatase MutT (NUDIX family)